MIGWPAARNAWTSESTASTRRARSASGHRSRKSTSMSTMRSIGFKRRPPPRWSNDSRWRLPAHLYESTPRPESKRMFPTGFRILISQMTQDRDVYIVFGKALGVLGHAELFEPVLNLLHGGHPTISSGHDRAFDHRDKEFIPILSAIAPPSWRFSLSCRVDFKAHLKFQCQ